MPTSIRVAVHHRTEYAYDRLVMLGPQCIRLRPAPHCRTPIISYSLRVDPRDHFLNWQQDPYGNYLARCVFPKPTRHLHIEVDLVADMTVINPFDFFVEPAAEHFPFAYEPWLAKELQPFLQADPPGPFLQAWLQTVYPSGKATVPFLVELNQRLQKEIGYRIRLEAGVQTPEQTLASRQGSCRDTAWLLIQILRNLGIASRFASGYLVQLTADQAPLEGPAGPDRDFTDLHAWAEVYLPGAGWVGLDPTSGLLTAEGHLPLACTPDPGSAAPVGGGVDPCEVQFSFAMNVQRLHEVPRTTRPYDDDEWQSILALGDVIDRQLQDADVRLTMGGEPTFVAIDDAEADEWNIAAVGPQKRQRAEQLIKQLRQRFAPKGLLHDGQGKWYPGESLPRWALSCYWRSDGGAIWQDPSLIVDSRVPATCTIDDARTFAQRLAAVLGIQSDWLIPAFEDADHYRQQEKRLPINVDREDPKRADPEEQARLVRVFRRGLDTPLGFVMPLCRQWPQSRGRIPAGPRWTSGPWPFRGERMSLLPGDSPLGLRLPLDALPWVPRDQQPRIDPADPMEPRPPLPQSFRQRQPAVPLPAAPIRPGQVQSAQEPLTTLAAGECHDVQEAIAPHVVRTAICIEEREGRIHVFMPPVARLEDYLELVAAVEQVASELAMAIVLEGYPPPHDPRIEQIKITPDPGVLEVNIQPARSWRELVYITETLYEESRLARLTTEKFDLDGKHTGTGGGNHVVLGGPTPADSPFLRRPDLLRSLVAYWLNHPSLSYLFSGRFVGPTSQAPRVDEGRRDALYELELAFAQVPEAGVEAPPWLVDRLFRNLLVDVVGNTHRAEFCIDKLYSPDSASGRLGLVELRAMEMPPHARMSLTQQLLIRALVAWLWQQPYRRAPIDWGTALYDRFLLPYFVWRDFAAVIDDLHQSRLSLQSSWFTPHFEFRFPLIGELTCQDVRLELRTAIEPWYVLGEEPAAGGTVRYVDSSVERLQVCVTGLWGDRLIVCCNGRRLPLQPTGASAEWIAGVRYRAWQPPHCLHPNIPVHTPLVFDVIDTWAGRAIAGCTYHVGHPAGRNYQRFPVNAQEAEARRAARFLTMGHTPGAIRTPPREWNPVYPTTLDLRRPVTVS